MKSIVKFHPTMNYEENNSSNLLQVLDFYAVV